MFCWCFCSGSWSLHLWELAAEEEVAEAVALAEDRMRTR